MIFPKYRATADTTENRCCTIDTLILDRKTAALFKRQRAEQELARKKRAATKSRKRSER